jgi:PAN domain
VPASRTRVGAASVDNFAGRSPNTAQPFRARLRYFQLPFSGVAMRPVQAVTVLCAAIISTTCIPAAPLKAGENKFVLVPRADSPGNDFLTVDNSSIEDCEHRCDADRECNSFTYNQLRGVCFLKFSANRMLTFHAAAITGVKLSPSVRPMAGASGSGPSFVILPQADSPGNDYSRIDDFSLEECRSRCEVARECNAYTYNLARGVCFLKRAANQWTSFYAWGITGIKLSSAPARENSETPQSPAVGADPLVEQAKPPPPAASVVPHIEDQTPEPPAAPAGP